MAHSVIAPSSAGIWGKPNGCTGYPLMAQMYPETESGQDAKEGNASHEIAAWLVDRLARGFDGVGGSLEKFIEDHGALSAEGVAFTQEMYDGARMYASACADLMRQTRVLGGERMGIEGPIKAPAIHEESWGTCDFWLFDRDSGVLYIYDYKFGRLLVEVFENWQLLNYFEGVATKLRAQGEDLSHVRVVFKIFQPRGFHPQGPVREWSVAADYVRAHVNILEHNAHKALGPDAELRTGKHCRYCEANHACPAALEAGVGLYEAVAQPMPQEMNLTQTGFQLQLVQRAMEQLGFLETAYKAQIDGAARRGEPTPGWRLDSKLGREVWNVPAEQVIQTLKLIDIDVAKPLDAITPNQAREKGVSADIVEQFSERKPAGLNLVPDTDNKAKKVFT